MQLNNLADMRIDEDVISEFRQLSRSFNQMLERLNNAFAAQRQFTGNAAHELRTPLALMQAQLELFSACLLYTSFFNTYFFQTIRRINTVYDLKYNK